MTRTQALTAWKSLAQQICKRLWMSKGVNVSNNKLSPWQTYKELATLHQTSCSPGYLGRNSSRTISGLMAKLPRSKEGRRQQRNGEQHGKLPPQVSIIQLAWLVLQQSRLTSYGRHAKQRTTVNTRASIRKRNANVTRARRRVEKIGFRKRSGLEEPSESIRVSIDCLFAYALDGILPACAYGATATWPSHVTTLQAVHLRCLKITAELAF
mmetsp:Transcript_18321/g.31356  ORF Transcript_18321/g.31356 Transcript_18321/m.31356 type:complete len:211 (-) Transcript_18321:461-1093(-)